jgi:transposase
MRFEGLLDRHERGELGQQEAAEIVGLYLDPPEGTLAIAVDETPRIQALERAQGCLKLPNGRALTRRALHYKRHGTSTLFAAFDIANGEVVTRHDKRRRRVEFLDFMNRIVAAHRGREIHVVLDNRNTHKPKRDRWRPRHKNVHFHFTPTLACWLNQVGCWLSIRGSCYHDREREDPGMGTTRNYVVIDPATGKLDRRIFSEQAIYDDEMEKIFGRAWLMIGHESLVPAVDDFFHTYMGEDPVILTRDGQGRLHALLNMCRHRGNRVVRCDDGNAKRFMCTFLPFMPSSSRSLAEAGL